MVAAERRSGDRNGIAMWTKRLEKGRFSVPGSVRDGGLTTIEAGELALVLDGLDLAVAHRRPRWEPHRVA